MTEFKSGDRFYDYDVESEVIAVDYTKMNLKEYPCRYCAFDYQKVGKKLCGKYPCMAIVWMTPATIGMLKLTR